MQSYYDKTDRTKGLYLEPDNIDPQKRITVRDNLIQIDTRDCVGRQSLTDAINIFKEGGGRLEASGLVMNSTGVGVSPIVLTLNSVSQLRNGDCVSVCGVRGNVAANGNWKVNNIDVVFNTVSLVGSVGNGDYMGGGTWKRCADPGLPGINDNTSTVFGNVMNINLGKKLKILKSISLIHAIIPRDLVPLESYLPDFINSITTIPTLICPAYMEVYDTFIPQEREHVKQRILGFYSTPIDLFRSYFEGSFIPPDPATPPPLVLWNPPIGVWPDQPKPYPFQTVPTYRSREFPIPNMSGTFHIVCSGYGVYDLNDWVFTAGPPAVNEFITILARKLLLLLIMSVQSYRGQDIIDLVINCRVVDVGTTGYGDFQRFLPGPGIGQSYQPGTSDGADPTVVGVDWPIAFPNFRGNVWGPYDSPGDRFQKVGVRTLIQDLYLNGDTNNLLGDSIIKSNIPIDCLMNDDTFGINLGKIISVNFTNIASSSNLNIKNAARLLPNGFGAATFLAQGDGVPPYFHQLLGTAGGQGPSVEGTPQAWVDGPITGGVARFGDPIAAGPQTISAIPQNVQADHVGDDTDPRITHRRAWYDLGPNSGSFVESLIDYQNWMIAELPDTNIVMHLAQGERSQRTQSTNSNVQDSIFSCPIRLDLGSTAGTQQYIENVQALLAGSSPYWKKRYLSPKQSMYKLYLTFTTYDGAEIPLERMLIQSRGVEFIQSFERLFGEGGPFGNFGPPELGFLNCPLDPRLINRMQRNISLMFNVETYQYESPGLYMGVVRDLLEKERNMEEDDDNNFVVRANNYEDYSSITINR